MDKQTIIDQFLDHNPEKRTTEALKNIYEDENKAKDKIENEEIKAIKDMNNENSDYNEDSDLDNEDSDDSVASDKNKNKKKKKKKIVKKNKKKKFEKKHEKKKK
eukprot:149712_1